MDTIRTRFAPSPTGFLHIGGARTALFNWLFARHNNGTFILRIEDTDTKRSTRESINTILESMLWLGLEWDEGPYLQSDRFPAYRRHVETLLENKTAYKCWCTPEELEERRKAAIADGRPPRYDRRCIDKQDAPAEGPYGVRFRIPEGRTSFNDLIKGPISFDNSELEDLVILRSNSTPTYNLCVVVDDHAMNITDVIRGDDHINNTPKQILLGRALGFNEPRYAHLPMILGSDGKRLSKRHGAMSVTAYRDMGFLPDALVNYLARLGWSHGDEEIFSQSELIEKFSLDNVGKSSGIFNKEKLLWLNQHYLKSTPDPRSLIEPLASFLGDHGVNILSEPRAGHIIKTLLERSTTLKDMAEGALFYFKDDIEYEAKAAKKYLTPDTTEIFISLIEKLEALDKFTEEAIENAFQEVLDATGLKLGKVAQPVRVAITGTTVSPGIYETLAALGRETTIERLINAREYTTRPGSAPPPDKQTI